MCPQGRHVSATEPQRREAGTPASRFMTGEPVNQDHEADPVVAAASVSRFPDRIVEAGVGWVERRSKATILILGAVVLGLAGGADYFVAPQMTFSPLYFIPIILVAGGVGRAAGIVMAFVCLVVWLLAEKLMPTGFKPPFITLWYALWRLGAFVAVAWVASVIRAFRDELEGRVAKRTAALVAEVAARRQAETQWRDTQERLLEVSEHEKCTLGEDLHDGLSQELIGLALAAKLAGQQLRDRRPVSASQFEDIVLGLNQAAARTRSLAQGLYPLKLEHQGLTLALREFCEEIQKTSHIPCDFVAQSPVALADGEARQLYRIAQEAIRNALKHAQAGRITVLLSGGDGQVRWCIAEDDVPANTDCRTCVQPGQVTLCVADDGVGFPTRTPSQGMGLAIMSCRARQLGAALAIQRPATGGTRVTCALPVNGHSAPPQSESL